MFRPRIVLLNLFNINKNNEILQHISIKEDKILFINAFIVTLINLQNFLISTLLCFHRIISNQLLNIEKGRYIPTDMLKLIIKHLRKSVYKYYYDSIFEKIKYHHHTIHFHHQ